MIILPLLPGGCEPKEDTVRLAFLGDVLVGRGVTLSDDSLRYLEAELQSADLAMANLESPLTSGAPVSSDGYNLCAPSDNAQALAQAGLDLLAIVNNHSLDCGLQGRMDTHSALETNGLKAIDDTGYTTRINGLKLTFFAFEDISQPVDLAGATRSIQAAHLNGSLVIVSIHWGMEYQGGASQRQKEVADQFAAAGATVIWGHHPHVLQAVDWIPAECGVDEERSGCSLVLYSLGNALFDQAGLPDTRRSALVSVVLDGNGIVATQTSAFVIDPVHSLIKAPDKVERDLILSRLNLP